MTSIHIQGDALWARMERAVEKVQERIRKVAVVLEAAGVPYAVVGGIAVGVWVAQVDEAAVRNTKDVDVLIRRADWQRVLHAMSAVGFTPQETLGVTMFIDPATGKPRDAVHIVFADEKVRPDDLEPNPDVEPHDASAGFRIVPLEALVRMKLTAYLLKDRVHLLDMLEVGLIDATWLEQLSEPLRERLQALIDNPNG